MLANFLVQNSSTESAYELNSAQATFHALTDGNICVVGAIGKVSIGTQTFDSNLISWLKKGDEVMIQAPTEGARTYVAWQPASSGRLRQLAEPPESVRLRHQLRIVAGPQLATLGTFSLDSEFTVTRVGDRVGIRLQESIGTHSLELASEPQCVGTIQISNDGTPIILGPDGPTIGGYPKVAVVISCDISRLGQLMPGDKIRFTWVTIEEAHRLNLESASGLKRHQVMFNLGI